jgi:hypothetical protein
VKESAEATGAPTTTTSSASTIQSDFRIPISFYLKVAEKSEYRIKCG